MIFLKNIFLCLFAIIIVNNNLIENYEYLDDCRNEKIILPKNTKFHSIIYRTPHEFQIVIKKRQSNELIECYKLMPIDKSALFCTVFEFCEQ